jgi:hypothetical protein
VAPPWAVRKPALAGAQSVALSAAMPREVDGQPNPASAALRLGGRGALSHLYHPCLLCPPCHLGHREELEAAVR